MNKFFKIKFKLAYLWFMLFICQFVNANTVKMVSTTKNSSFNHITITKTTFICTQAVISYTIKNSRINLNIPFNSITVPDGSTILINPTPENVTTYTQIQNTINTQNNNNMTNTSIFYCIDKTIISNSSDTQKINKTMQDNNFLILSPKINNPWNDQIPDYSNYLHTNQFWTRFSQSLFQQQNLARTNPKLYATYVRAQLNNFTSDNRTIRLGNQKYVTEQGTKAWQEAIKYLENATEMHPLSRVQCLDQAAQYMVNDAALNKIMWHNDSQGNSPSQRQNRHCSIPYGGENIAWGFNSARSCIIQLIVDDGVKDRGHRQNIFNPQYIQGGVWAGNYPSPLYNIAVFEYLVQA